MPLFKYRVKNKFGDTVRGTVQERSSEILFGKLDTIGYTVLSIEPLNQVELALHRFAKFFERITAKDVYLFSRQMATMLRSGIPLLGCLNSVIAQTTNDKFKRVLQDVTNEVENGALSFSGALEKYPSVFPQIFTSLVRVGEFSGKIEEMMERVAKLGESDAEMRARIQSALYYPCILIVMAVFIITGIMVFVLPKFIKIFESANIELPLPTRMLLGTVHGLREYWYLVLGFLAGGVAAVRYFFDPEKVRLFFHRALIRIPVFGNLVLKILFTRFARTLSTLIKSGINILQALDVTEKVVGNQQLIRVIQTIRTSLAEGQSMSEPFELSGIFPPMVTQMVSVGEQTGKLEETLEEVAVYYEKETDYALKNLMALIEPLMLLFMGGFVLLIALSVLMPMFQMVSVFRK